MDLGSLFVRNNLEYQQKQSSSDAKNNAKNNAVLTDKINVTLESFNVIRFVCNYFFASKTNWGKGRLCDYKYSKSSHNISTCLPENQLTSMELNGITVIIL